MINFFLLLPTLLRFLVHQRARDCIIWIFLDSVTSKNRHNASDRRHFTLDISVLTEAVITLIVAAGILLGSPGPATMSLAAVGASVGFRKGLPYLAGILIGLLCAMTGGVLGVAAIFVKWPHAELLVQILGTLYLVYISYRIACAPLQGDEEFKQQGAPSFIDGVALNLLNPKLYAAFFVLFSQFLLPLANPVSSYSATCVLIAAIAVIVDTTWLAIGSSIQAIFAHPRYARPVRVLFALSILVATAWALLP